IAYGRGGATETVLPASESCAGTGLFFEEQTPDSLCQAIAWFEAHPDRTCSELCRQHSLNFTAARYEREVVAHLERVAGRDRSYSAHGSEACNQTIAGFRQRS